MRNLAHTLIVILVISVAGYGQRPLEEMFLRADQLLSSLDNKNLVVLHVGAEEVYNEGHIPGAQLIQLRDYVITTPDSLYTQLPTFEYLDSLFRARGISDKSLVVLYYGGDRFASTFQLYYSFEYIGFTDKVYILDGGLRTWNNLGYNLSTDIPEIKAVKKDKLTFDPNPWIVADKFAVKTAMNSRRTTIVDARTWEYYSGEKDGNGRYKRPGHIGNAKNITWLDIVDENQKLKSQNELRSFFVEQDIGQEQDVITYCHVGLRATVIWTVAQGLGHKALMYDGSFNEWDRLDEEYTVERSSAKKKDN